ncbi:hypothetical protein DERP_006959 [Dermatophagoides pteronyssinus]|uniref:Uncharacterized protein n=1 Tax=Dermatophagoides pteronyssinus TaxID=6956 RepID=A0ABQ8JTS8_DERPT|nr:hypothetical protein DERP_006959 [Dermatophagoides pteronyssinus]
MLKNLIAFRNLSATASSILLRYDFFLRDHQRSGKKKKYFHYSSSLSMDIIYYDPWILRKK